MTTFLKSFKPLVAAINIIGPFVLIDKFFRESNLFFGFQKDVFIGLESHGLANFS